MKYIQQMNLKKSGKNVKGRFLLKSCQIKSGLISLIFIFLVSTGFSQKQWQKEILRSDPVICQASNETGHSYVSPPEGFLNRLKSGKKTSSIVVQYVNVPDSVKPAIKYAAEIWEYLISSSVPIYLKVSWEVLDKTTLGSCGATSYYHNFEGAPLRNTYYPVAVVEKITGKEISGSGNPDMIARFNSTIPWYNGTDGKTPNNRYDLVSIVLHEITHGLGFNGFIRANTTQKTASYGLTDDFPAVYDCFVENTSGNKLTDAAFYTNYSNDLYKTITSGSLYSGGPVTVKWGNARSRLYAPATYSSGSSIYHLNDLTYTYGNINALMTSSAGKGEAIHSPGPLTSGMLADIGWKYLSINFKPLKDFETPADSITFNTLIQSDLGIKSKSVNLIFSRDLFKTHRDTARFETLDVDGNFRVRIKTGFTSGKLSYYIIASDTIGRKFTSPYNFPDSLFTLTIGPDNSKPVIISHSPKFLLSYPGTFEITASVKDNIGVDSVKVIFFKNGKESVMKKLESRDNDIYGGVFNLKELNLEDVDSIRYSILAVDKSLSKNTSQLPDKGTFAIKLEKIQSPVKEYSNNFETQLGDFILSDFIINTEFGFANNALNSPHPYPSPDKDNDSLEFTTILRYPIVLHNKGGMSYDEVVLVEPGEPGTVYGSGDFYDYVIVEGSKNWGKEWLPLIDGYDSGSQESWKSEYNKQISGNNSLTAGSKNLFIRHQFNLTANGNFKGGDTIIVRFRLHSDPFAHGWGWTIDNLNIQNTTFSGLTTGVSAVRIVLWPNPANTTLNIQTGEADILKECTVDILDLTGRILIRETRHFLNPGQVIRMDLKNIPKGIYIVNINADNMLKFSGKIVKTIAR
jgi:hypothetical protein